MKEREPQKLVTTIQSYRIRSSQTIPRSATLFLRPGDHCDHSAFSTITLSITLLPCPRGFERHEGRCICDRRLTDFFNNTVCDIDTETVERRGPIWLRYGEDYLKVHSHCPLDYCDTSITSAFCILMSSVQTITVGSCVVPAKETTALVWEAPNAYSAPPVLLRPG